MACLLRQFWKSEDGSTAIEYAFIGLIVGLGIISSLRALPTALSNIFGNVGANLNVN